MASGDYSPSSWSYNTSVERSIMNNQYNRGNDILAGLMQLMGGLPQGDGVRTFNPMPDRDQIENVIRRILPQQDGVREFAIPDKSYFQQFAQQSLPKNIVNNRTY